MKSRTAKLIFPLITFLLSMTACSDDTEPESRIANRKDSTELNTKEISVKLKAEIVRDIDTRKRILRIPTGSEELDDFLRKNGANQLSRIFPHAGKDEYKQEREELHHWYTLVRREWNTIQTRGMIDDLYEIATYAEPVSPPQMSHVAYAEVPEPLVTRSSNTGSLFNDPLYARQWNLRNEGTIGNYTDAQGNVITSSIAGADINIEPVWKETTGNPHVVLAVVDGGIDLTHPDLQGSLWINEDELPGNGIDDDNNGYVDDYHGYNFVDDTCAIVATRHGTHVAGIIAARNNNGLGICGIAGGDGSANTGVRLMSCQIFRKNPNHDPTNPESTETIGTGNRNLDAAAIVYGANNGAIISQNSWGFGTNYKSTPQVIKEAIAYFNKYAGGNKTKQPLMKGGIVLFASGNDGWGRPTYPAAEENVISVAAWNPDFQAAWYTNYGETIDIAAPGGTQPENEKYQHEKGFPTSAILSTVPRKEGGSGGYAYMQGTSMACPHVAGIAALIISKYGNADFTAEQLRQHILTGVKAMDYNKYVEKHFSDKMGLGYADAVAAMFNDNNPIVPSAPEFLTEKLKSGYNNVTVAWKSTNTATDGSLQSYIVYWSSSPISPDNYQQASFYKINANYAEVDAVFERTHSGLFTNTSYYFALQAVARNGKKSPITILQKSIKTLNNTAPTIEADIEGHRITIAGKDVRTIHFTIKDKENHKWKYSFKNVGLISVIAHNNGLTVHIDADKYLPGIYHSELIVTDEYHAQSSYPLVVEVVADRVPSLRVPEIQLNIKKGQQKKFSLTDIVDNEDLTELTYSITNGEQVETALTGNILSVKGVEIGESYIEISATDIHGQTGTFRIPIFVYENEGIYALYPTIATNMVYLKVGEIIDGNVILSVRNTAGKQIFSQTFHTSSLNTIKRTYPLDVQKLPPGSYTLNIQNLGKVYYAKFIRK